MFVLIFMLFVYVISYKYQREMTHQSVRSESLHQTNPIDYFRHIVMAITTFIPTKYF